MPSPARNLWLLVSAVCLTVSCGMLLEAHAAPKRADAKKADAKKADAKKAAAKPAPKKQLRETDVSYPPELPGGKTLVSDTSPEFLKPIVDLKSGVKIAKAVPTVDFMYYPGQNYVGKPWSNWGDSVAADGKYYSAIGDHLAIGAKGDEKHTGTGFVFEYDPQTKKLRELVDTTKVLKLPEGHYTPGKIHSRLDMGSDGKLYFSTHRGSPKAASDANHYKGDWIFRCDPKTAETEIVALVPVAKHSCPNSVLDPDRLIF